MEAGQRTDNCDSRLIGDDLPANGVSTKQFSVLHARMDVKWLYNTSVVAADRTISQSIEHGSVLVYCDDRNHNINC